MSGKDDQKAMETVLAVMGHPSMRKLTFTIETTMNTKPVYISTRSISPAMYEKVAKAITAAQIKIIVEPKLLGAGVVGQYYSTMTLDKDTEFYDVIVLRTPDLGSTINEQFHTAAAIVHECTHAGFDLLKEPKMTHLEHEAASYVAGALFMVESMLAKKGLPAKVSWKQPIHKAAWDIALLVADGKPVPKALYKPLDDAIRADPEYKDKADKDLDNDGVGREWKVKKPGK